MCMKEKIEKRFWEKTLERSIIIPDKDLEKLPEDLSENFEHYMYGAPKQDDPMY